MIKLVLKGGLGNQMFQYAAAKALAKKLDCAFEIDLSFMHMHPPIKGYTVREYELDLFDLKPKLTSLTANPLIEKYLSYGIQYLQFRLSSRKHYVEKDPYKFDPAFFELSDSAILEGYFNNIKYLNPIEAELKNDFDLDKFYDEKYAAFEKDIQSKNSISINIRRGDYLNSKYSSTYVFLDENYYREAMRLMKSRFPDVHYYVFSYDDPQWFKDTFELSEDEFTMVGKEYVGEKFKTYLRLISLCKHNIISNSTFAFWGAYLNKNSDKLVIAPRQWSKVNADFEAPVGWELINVYSANA